MSKNRVSNCNARKEVEALQEFVGSNMFAEWREVGSDRERKGIYVVFSYGRHFPMYAWDAEAQVWIGNSDKFSRSTTRQQSQARPSKVDKWMSASEIGRVVEMGGLVNYVVHEARN